MLKVALCDHKAVKYACTNWHYSKSVPVGRLFKVGVWEDTKYIGCVVFSRGANRNLGKLYGLSQEECCELTRIALTEHKCTVTTVMAKAIKELKKQNKKMRLIVSFADPEQGHNGAVYQACNWIYSGVTTSSRKYIYGGRILHNRQVSVSGAIMSPSGIYEKCPTPSQCEVIKTAGKHRYLFPLDRKMRKQVMKLSKHYPKRVEHGAENAPAFQVGELGAEPRTRSNEAITNG